MNKLLLTALLFSFGLYANPKGEKIAKDCDQKNSNFVSESSEIEMTLLSANGDKTVRKITNSVLEVKGDGNKSLITFLWPKDVKGTKLLTWSHIKSDDDQWLYLPSFRRVKRISSKGKSGAFMGSEFTFEDLAGNEVEKYSHDFIREDKFDERKVWVLNKFPKDSNSGYSRQEVWLDEKYCNPLKVSYFDKKKQLLKVSHLKKYSKFGKFWRSSYIDMKNVQTGKSSILSWNKRKMGEKMSERSFSKKSLKK